METPDRQVGSYWIDSAGKAQFPTLVAELSVDVAIIGGGMVGVIAGRLLKEAGLTVAVVEAQRIGHGVSGKATAKVTSQHGTKYQTLADKYGEELARIYAEAQVSGMQLILDLAREHDVDCDLEEKQALVYTTNHKQVTKLEREIELASSFGLPATLTRDTDLPFDVAAAMSFDRQYQFHPVKFVAGLAATIPGDGSQVFEHSRVIDWDPQVIRTADGRVSARHVLMATNLPLGQVGLYYSMNYPKAEPGIAAPIDKPLPYYAINLGSPGRSIRTHRANGRTYAIAVGEHFRPGHSQETEKATSELEQWLKRHFGTGEIECRWINEDYSPMDGAPFVGWSSSVRDGYLVATGFDGWGFTNSAAAAFMIRDLVLEQENPWLELFNATRIKPVAGAGKFVHENMHVAEHFVNDYTSSKPKSYDALNPGEAAILSIDGEKIAAFKEDDGKVRSVSAVCTHMGCLVGWNPTDRTWDCPCHGSRFNLDGEVLHGPAVTGLERKNCQ